MDDLTITFDFETEFKKTLKCVPMAVRIKLDLAGIKLSLKEWAQLTTDDKHALLRFPWEGNDAAVRFAAVVDALVGARAGKLPARLPVPSPLPWRAEAVPDPVATKAAAEGMHVGAERWAALSPLQRFALVKLSRPGHENANFVVAAREFGAA